MTHKFGEGGWLVHGNKCTSLFRLYRRVDARLKLAGLSSHNQAEMDAKLGRTRNGNKVRSLGTSITVFYSTAHLSKVPR
jgi:hypothetical protein